MRKKKTKKKNCEKKKGENNCEKKKKRMKQTSVREFFLTGFFNQQKAVTFLREQISL